MWHVYLARNFPLKLAKSNNFNNGSTAVHALTFFYIINFSNGVAGSGKGDLKFTFVALMH